MFSNLYIYLLAISIHIWKGDGTLMSNVELYM